VGSTSVKQIILIPLILLLALATGAVLWTRTRSARSELSPLVGRHQAIENPVLGVLHLDTESPKLWETEDRPAIASLFAEVREGAREIPRCDVLFIYGTLDTAGRFNGSHLGLREIVREASAKIVVVASNNPGHNYVVAGHLTGYGLANLVMVLDRKGEAFPRFMRELFSDMFRGTPMPIAWVRLVPQGPPASDIGLPESIFAAELGGLTFESAPLRHNGR
jgi:hypothetical protein